MILLMLMVDSGIPELSNLEDVAWVHRALMLNERDNAKAAAPRGSSWQVVVGRLDDRRTRSMHNVRDPQFGA